MKGRAAWRMWAMGAALLVAVGCGEDQPVAAQAVADAGAIGSLDSSALSDGWQFVQDANAPDGWVWSADAQAWIGPDATATEEDSSAGDSVTGADSDAKSASDAAKQPAALGGFCQTIADCPNGAFCAGAGSSDAYCTTYGCTKSSDCGGIPASDLVCCVSYGTGNQKESYCLKQPGATHCGTQNQPVGGDCAKGGQSDCSGDASWCYQTSGASQCVQTCAALNDPSCPKGTTCNVFPGGGGCLPFTPGVADGSPCAQDTLGGCGKYAFCIENAKGDPLAYCATACTTDSACAAGSSCFVYNGAQGICQHNGSQSAGGNCAGDRFSCAKGLFCVGFGTGDAVCAPGCMADGDCASLGSAYCVKNPGESGGVCYPKGSGSNGAPCADNPYVCAQGLYCNGGYDGYNPGAFCQQACTDGSACPTGAVCTVYTKDYSGCQPNGALGQGADCKGNSSLCEAGAFCVGAASNWQCMTQCTLASASCPGNTWCTPYGQDGLGVCWPTGSKGVGSSCVGDPWGCEKGALCASYGVQKNASCLENCDSAPCPNGFTCDDFGQSGQWCQPVGAGGQGATCSLAAPCVTGAVCVGQEGPAPFCATQCSADSDCPAVDVNGQKLWCAKGQWGGYCLPNGGIAKNGICYQQPWACAKGLVCLGDSAANPGAFCAQTCSGFASICAPGEKCEYLGGGDAFCFKTGSMPVDSECLQDPLGCTPDALCIKGSPLPECIQQCGVGFPACPASSPCTSFVGSPVKLCVPKDFVPFGVISVPF